MKLLIWIEDMDMGMVTTSVITDIHVMAMDITVMATEHMDMDTAMDSWMV